ncbi:MAG: tetratricopeptide repeat protein [Flavobacterium sp.]|nr:tetratricopeptide repeat protein [Flavobacterium sp.]
MKSLLCALLFIPGILFSQSVFENAEKLFRQQKYNDAKALFETLLKDQPNDLKILEYLGDINGISKNWDAALVYYKKLKVLKPSNADYHYKYGGVLGMIANESNKFKALGMIDDIKQSFQKAIELNPKHIDARWALVEFYLKLPGIIGGSETKATRYANELLTISPIDGYLAKGRIAEYFERYKEAEKLYKIAIQIGSSKICYQKLSDLYKNKMNQPEKAKQIMAEFDQKTKS